MADVAYRSQVRIERVKGPLRKAYLPAEPEPVLFGVHGAVARHYKVPDGAVEAAPAPRPHVGAGGAG